MAQTVTGRQELTASAEEYTYENLEYVFLDDGTIEISGCVDTSITGDLEIPSEIDGVAVTSIGEYAFYRARYSSIVIPDSVTAIQYEAFCDCFSSSITIGASVETIGTYAFNNSEITSITIPDSVTTIYGSAFNGCDAMTSITFGTGVTTIESHAFLGCSVLEAVYITDIAAWISIDFQGSYVNPLEYAKNLYLDGVLLTDLVVPDTITNIRANVFYNCLSLKTVTIPDSVTHIQSSAFQNCSRLTTVTLPNTIVKIGEYAFQGCDSLADVYYDGTEDLWNTIDISVNNRGLDNATMHFVTSDSDSDSDSDSSSTTGSTLSSGDLDGDGTVSITDASTCLNAYANAAAGNANGLTAAQEAAADVDGDGSITIQDASYILQYYANAAAGNTVTWDSILK